MSPFVRLAAPALAVATALAAGPARAADPNIPFEKLKLDNGLTVLLSEDHRLPQVAVNIWYHVGAANQTPGRSGFAHLFEHMMFSGSKHVQPSPFAVLEAIGVSAGPAANGTTSYDRTNYFEVVPSNELATALWIESDRMGYLLDTLDAQKLQVQRDVVSNERRQNYENRAYGQTALRTCDLLYPAPHPYFECVIGSIDEIQTARVDDVKAFFREFYAPSNATLAIVGDFDPAAAKALVAKYFGSLPTVPAVKRPDVPQPMLTSVVKQTIEDPVAEVPRLDLIWTGVKPFSEDEAAGDVLMEVLGGSKTSRLSRSMVFGSKVAADVSGSNDSRELGGSVHITALANDGRAASELLAPIQAAIDELKKNGPTVEEVERAKRQYIAELLRLVERIGGFGGKADLLNHYQTFVGDPGYLAKDLARYRAVTPESVKAFALKYLPDDRRIELTTVPKAKAGTGGAP